MTEAVRTRDLFEGGWLLTQGASLAEVVVDENGMGKPKVTFFFQVDQGERLTAAFRLGQAMVEVTRLRAAVNHLRDLLFEAIRRNGTETGNRNAKGDGRWTTDCENGWTRSSRG